MACGLVNLGSCLPQKLFEFFLSILNSPIQPFLEFTIDLLTQPINIDLFLGLWVIVVYVISITYSLLFIAAGINFIISGHNASKRENAKSWLGSIVIMIILIQASFFLYGLAIDISSILTSAIMTLVEPDFFLIGTEGILDLGISFILSLVYLLTLVLTSLILVMRYAFVAVGVMFLPLGIFLYFFPPLKAYGILILNFLGIAIFITFFDALLLVGFSQLVSVPFFGDFKILILISGFLLTSIFMLLAIAFGVIKSGASVYGDIKKIRGLVK